MGQEENANVALYNIITDSQRKRQWTVKYEGIMLKLMELSVKLRKPNLIKEALHKYRALCSGQNVASLEKVCRDARRHACCQSLPLLSSSMKTECCVQKSFRWCAI